MAGTVKPSPNNAPSLKTENHRNKHIMETNSIANTSRVSKTLKHAISHQKHEITDIHTFLSETGKAESRGFTPTKLKHIQNMEGRLEIECNANNGKLIGPSKKEVQLFSQFLDTLARNTTLVTLLYTNWIAVPKENRDALLDRARSKYTIPTNGEPWVLATIGEAWKKYKSCIKEKHCTTYRSFKEIWKNRPGIIPDSHFRKLIRYWKLDVVKENVHNLKESEYSDDDTFQTLFGKEQYGRVRCYGRSVTKTSLKKEKEINQLKQHHKEEIASLEITLNAKMDSMMNLVKMLLQQANPGLSHEQLQVMMETAQQSQLDANSVPDGARQNIPPSSGSSHVPNFEESRLE
ncbi:hypothetical protein PIB30_026611 [Stylosanthes scabra]|uniref:Transposase, Ptta/En/Spm, plant n=1 Tax=Stylosanthes scabra TaxID=79078 RepID=A0ABU6WA23_9FABA|nr:hypothetical protein [Stylosanthes scabra]